LLAWGVERRRGKKKKRAIKVSSVCGATRELRRGVGNGNGSEGVSSAKQRDIG